MQQKKRATINPWVPHLSCVGFLLLGQKALLDYRVQEGTEQSNCHSDAVKEFDRVTEDKNGNHDNACALENVADCMGNHTGLAEGHERHGVIKSVENARITQQVSNSFARKRRKTLDSQCEGELDQQRINRHDTVQILWCQSFVVFEITHRHLTENVSGRERNIGQHSEQEASPRKLDLGHGRQRYTENDGHKGKIDAGRINFVQDESRTNSTKSRLTCFDDVGKAYCNI